MPRNGTNYLVVSLFFSLVCTAKDFLHLRSFFGPILKHVNFVNSLSMILAKRTKATRVIFIIVG